MNYTTEAMIDLLFEVRVTSLKIDRINGDLNNMVGYEDDFSSHLRTMEGRIESRMADALDLYFEEITGCESLASNFLYETGTIIHGGEEYQFHDPDQFKKFVAFVRAEE